MSVLSLLIDTSVWIDLASRRDGQKWIVSMRQLVRQKKLRLLVPALVIDEFERNRPKAEQAMTSRVAERFKLLRSDIGTAYRDDELEESLQALDGLAHHLPLIGAMTTRNFDDILGMLKDGAPPESTPEDQAKVVQRGLDKKAPFHRSKNSVADALLFELYNTALAKADLNAESFCFATSNSSDFSRANGDKRLPHDDLEEAFAQDGSIYALGFEGLEAVLEAHFGDDLKELLEESDFEENPRTLPEIMAFEQEFFDRIWYQRRLAHIADLEAEGDQQGLVDLMKIAGPPLEMVEKKYGDSLQTYSDFEWGMLNGKLSAIRWVLGAEWDFLDT